MESKKYIFGENPLFELAMINEMAKGKISYFEENPFFGVVEILEANVWLRDSILMWSMIFFPLIAMYMLFSGKLAQWQIGDSFLINATILIGFTWLLFKIRIENIRNFVAERLKILLGHKQNIYAEYANLLVIVHKDVITPWVDPETVVSIMETIRKISADLKNSRSVLRSITGLKKFAFIFKQPKAFRSGIDDMVAYERNHFVTLMKDFTNSIQEWTTLHQKELVGIERELKVKSGTVENPSGKWAIDSQRIRIHAQIEKLNEMTNAL